MYIRICKGGTIYWKMNQGPNTLIVECYNFQNSSDGWHMILYSSGKMEKCDFILCEELQMFVRNTQGI